MLFSSICFVVGNGVGTVLGYGLGMLVDAHEERTGVPLFSNQMLAVTGVSVRGFLMSLEFPR